jgi:hypothetical protein
MLMQRLEAAVPEARAKSNNPNRAADPEERLVPPSLMCFVLPSLD